jgi:hypothetical protein
MDWIIANWAVIATVVYTILRFIESGMKTGKWDVWSLIKEFGKLG